jgi:hypothetical protein
MRIMIGDFLCWIGWHAWEAVISDGVNVFAPTFPNRHIEECRHCKKCRCWRHTLYGSVEYRYNNREQAIKFSPK